MRIINIIGILAFAYPVVKSYSFRAFFILANGIIYHSNETNQILRYYDVICNACFMAYTVYYYRHTLNIATFMTISYAINRFIYYKLNLQERKYLRYLSDLFHVLFVQYPGLYAITISS